MEILFLSLFALPSILVIIDFAFFLMKGERRFSASLNVKMEILLLIFCPLLFFVFDDKKNDCCNNSASFSPSHILTIYVLTFLCVIAYFYSGRKRVISPIIEVVANSFLLVGIVLNIFAAIQVEDPVWFCGNLPIILLFIFGLIDNHKKFLAFAEGDSLKPANNLERLAWKILSLQPFLKVPFYLFFACHCWP